MENEICTSVREWPVYKTRLPWTLDMVGYRAEAVVYGQILERNKREIRVKEVLKYPLAKEAHFIRRNYQNSGKDRPRRINLSCDYQLDYVTACTNVHRRQNTKKCIKDYRPSKKRKLYFLQWNGESGTFDVIYEYFDSFRSTGRKSLSHAICEPDTASFPLLSEQCPTFDAVDPTVDFTVNGRSEVKQELAIGERLSIECRVPKETRLSPAGCWLIKLSLKHLTCAPQASLGYL